MPQRRRTSAPIALAAALITATAALSGCTVEVPAGAIPAPFSQAPVPSASVGHPAYVCTAVYQVLTDGAVRLAPYTTGDADAVQGLRDTFAAMSADVAAAAATSIDPAQRGTVERIAGSLDEAARGADPRAFLTGEFRTISQELDDTCA
ncbi:hypothetical protein [Actinoplanes sp. DH11]|uniref:hypothetical protein n=1 Tax=Actinoplanes sp. DH11 TaxID=2857011 RepID=UPI001E473D42|nr:hypothetical protein [Actinoplanes sp. DH11]